MTPETERRGSIGWPGNLVATSRACNIAARQASFVRLDAR